jgi:hypothetical protein
LKFEPKVIKSRFYTLASPLVDLSNSYIQYNTVVFYFDRHMISFFNLNFHQNLKKLYCTIAFLAPPNPSQARTPPKPKEASIYQF